MLQESIYTGFIKLETAADKGNRCLGNVGPKV